MATLSINFCFICKLDWQESIKKILMFRRSDFEKSIGPRTFRVPTHKRRPSRTVIEMYHWQHWFQTPMNMNILEQVCRFLLSDIFVFTPSIKRACCCAFSKCVFKLTDVNARIYTFPLLHAYYNKVCIWNLPFFVWKSYSHILRSICVYKYILGYLHTDTHFIFKN